MKQNERGASGTAVWVCVTARLGWAYIHCPYKTVLASVSRLNHFQLLTVLKYYNPPQRQNVNARVRLKTIWTSVSSFLGDGSEEAERTRAPSTTRIHFRLFNLIDMLQMERSLTLMGLLSAFPYAITHQNGKKKAAMRRHSLPKYQV